MPNPDLLSRTAANRRRIADLYDTAPLARLDGPSLCAGWDLRTLLGHVVTPLVVSPARLAVAGLRHRSIHRASTALAAELGRHPVGDLTALLRERADRAVTAPGVGPMGQFADMCIHLRDAARPLGVDADVPAEDWLVVLDWLPTRAAALGHVPRGRLRGVTWRATDVHFTYGAGPLVEGPAEALALAMTGRDQVHDELGGPGVGVLRRTDVPPPARRRRIP